MADQARRRQAPSGAMFEVIAAADGWPLRVASWAARGEVRGTAILVHGRREFIEKYYETVADLLDRGYAVVTMDWRGQGLSGRLLADRQKGHITSFDTFVSDLSCLVRWAMARFSGPYLLIGHSMGGHVVMRYLGEQPANIAAAVVVAPMTAISFYPLPEAVARLMTQAACGLGFAERYAPVQGPYSPAARRAEAGLLTSDLDRLEDEIVACEAYPDLALGGITYGWLQAALYSIDILRSPNYAEAISVPMLAITAGCDRVVKNRDTRRFIRRLQQGRLIDIPDARHEIFKERDDLRAWLWAAFDGFTAKAVK